MSTSGTLPTSGPALPSAAAPAPAGKGRRRWPRRLLWSALAVVIVVTLAFFGGGGWYFAGQIRSGALTVEPAGPIRAYDDVRVVGLPAGQVLHAAVAWALGHGAQRVVLAGQSMGGAVVAAFLEHSPLAATVTRVVFDAPMLDLQAVVGYGASQRTLPVIGTGVPAPLTWTAEQIAAARFGVNWAATDYLHNTAWLKVPALVTHGGGDTKVPISTSTTLKQAKPALVTFAPFPGAGHVESWNTDQPRYAALLESFLTPVAP